MYMDSEKKDQRKNGCCCNNEKEIDNERCCGGGCADTKEDACCQEKETSCEKFEGGVMQRDEFKLRICVVLFHAMSKKVCVARCSHVGGSFYKKYGPWDLFGGHMKLDDISPEEALRREVKEESGQEIENIFCLGAVPFGGYGKVENRILLGYTAECTSENIILSNEYSEFRWESVEAILSNEEYKPWIKEFVRKAQMVREVRTALYGWKQCAADFENYKKGQMNVGKEYATRAIEGFVTALLPVSDNFHTSTDHIPEDQKSGAWVQGILYIQQQLDAILSESGIEVINVQEGDIFNPSEHEAVSAQENREEGDKHSKKQIIVKVIQKGYRYDGKILRPARVSVK